MHPARRHANSPSGRRPASSLETLGFEVRTQARAKRRKLATMSDSAASSRLRRSRSPRPKLYSTEERHPEPARGDCGRPQFPPTSIAHCKMAKSYYRRGAAWMGRTRQSHRPRRLEFMPRKCIRCVGLTFVVTGAALLRKGACRHGRAAIEDADSHRGRDDPFLLFQCGSNCGFCRQTANALRSTLLAPI